jgi:hypothetical protein
MAPHPLPDTAGAFRRANKRFFDGDAGTIALK